MPETTIPRDPLMDAMQQAIRPAAPAERTTEALGIALPVTPLEFDPAREVKRWRRAGTDYRDEATGARVEVMHDQTMPRVVFRITPGHADARAYDVDLADMVAAVLDLHRARMAERRAAA